VIDLNRLSPTVITRVAGGSSEPPLPKK